MLVILQMLQVQIQFLVQSHQQAVAAVQKQMMVIMPQQEAQVAAVVPDHVRTEAVQEILHQ